MVETIISPSAILASSDVFVQWTQEGFKDLTLPGRLCFSSHDGLLSMFFNLTCRNGLYYCTTDTYMVDHDPVHARCHRTTVVTPATLAVPPPRKHSKFAPTSKARQIESEVWALCFGSPGKQQLDVLPRHVIGTPPVFEYHVHQKTGCSTNG
jgi:hypothetical protein